ncbi:hypothetical protein B0T42_01370 [Rathayibacter sp. VKM Ac-2630]|nr:hypothetical protein B0T42_01370 [Rathayibacter sp. VKM Ac-2630]
MGRAAAVPRSAVTWRERAARPRAVTLSSSVRGIIDRGTLYRFRHRAIEAYLTSEWPRVE